MTKLPPPSSPPRSPRRTWRVVPLVLLVTAGLALYLLVPRKPTPRAHVASADGAEPLSSVAPRLQPPVLAGTPVAELPAVPDEQRMARVPSAPPPMELAPETQALVEEFVPGTTEWEETPLDPGSSTMIRFLPKLYNVVAPAPIVLYLEIVDRKRQPAQVQSVQVRLRQAGQSDGEEDSWTTLTPLDDGRGEDTAAGDGRFTATLAPDGERQTRLLGRVLAEATVVTLAGDTRKVPAGLIYTRGPRARLTGAWRDRVEDGHLVLEADVQVDEPGHFSLMAQLVGPQPGREPIAVVRDLYRALPAGPGTMVLKVWGKAIRDPQVDGPYQVVNVLLTRDHENTDYDPSTTTFLAHRTRPYRHGEFSSAPYVAPPSAGEDVGPNHPSQRDKPPALVPEAERERLAAR